MGLKEFDLYFSEIYKDRWPTLKPRLRHQNRIEFYLKPPFSKVSDFKKHTAGVSIPRNSEDLLSYYALDPASVLVANLLPVDSSEKVLDMCAAPGGKSLVLFSKMKKESVLFCNEISSGRREALKKVLQNYISLSDREGRVWIKGLDGAQYGLKQPESFDQILLDAPCSGEAHLLENAEEMSHWSIKRSLGLSIKQYSLLSSAWTALKPGGHILYSTCSISPCENDGVIQKLLKKKKDQVEIIKPELEIEPEWTQHGLQYLPDRSGMGPMYACLIRKKAN